MAAHTISWTTIVAVLISLTAALFARTWLQVELIEGGMRRLVAADVSYLIVPPILIVLLFPLWKTEKQFLFDQFRFQDIGWRLIMNALAIGLLIRLLWWSQIIAGTSFGFYVSADPDPIVGPVFSFECGSPQIVFVGFFVMAFLVPAVEEIVNRGFVQSKLHRRGFVISLVVSSIVFTVFHRYGSWPFAFLSGLVFGTQYWATRSLWSSLITHATFNGLIQIDWRCLSGQWNPEPEQLPLLVPGAIAASVFIVCFMALLFLLQKMMAAVTNNSPR